MKTLLVMALAATALLSAEALAAQPYQGEIVKLDAATGKVLLKHGAIKKFEMEPMTMGYRVANPSMLKDFKTGDHVTFDVDGADGRYTLTKIEKAK